MKSFLHIATALILIIGAGLVHGSWTNRWGGQEALLNALNGEFARVPMSLGGWTGTAREFTDHEIALTGASAWLHRTYTENQGGRSVSILMVGGLPGRIATHTPDACYPAWGYALGPAAPSTVHYGQPERAAEIREAVAVNDSSRGHGSTIQITWTFHGSRGWQAPENPRWAFAGAPTLIKLYVVSQPGDTDDHSTTATHDFLNLLLPEIDRLLDSSSVDHQE